MIYTISPPPTCSSLANLGRNVTANHANSAEYAMPKQRSDGKRNCVIQYTQCDLRLIHVCHL